jgi:tetratricopeptide (TPR) repeat protein
VAVYAPGYIALIAGLLVILLIAVLIRSQYKLLHSIPDIQGPDHKIRVIKSFLRKSILSPGKVKVKMLYMLALSYAEKGDYLAAYETCGKARRFGTRVEFPAAEIEILIHMGRLKPAHTILKELLAQSPKDSAENFISKFAHVYYLIYSGEDISEAREKLGKLRLFLTDESVHKRFPTREFKFSLLFLEAKIDMLEQKYSEARAKFTSIIESSRNYGNTRLAREELEYWTTRF